MESANISCLVQLSRTTPAWWVCLWKKKTFIDTASPKSSELLLPGVCVCGKMNNALKVRTSLALPNSSELLLPGLFVCEKKKRFFIERANLAQLIGTTAAWSVYLWKIIFHWTCFVLVLLFFQGGVLPPGLPLLLFQNGRTSLTCPTHRNYSCLVC